MPERQSADLESGPVHSPVFLPSRLLLTLLSPGGQRGRLSTLIFHRVLPRPDALFPEEGDAESFEAQIAQVAACFNVIPLPDAIQALVRGKLPQRAACITFDDGYADNAEVALPILQKYGLHATFFVASSFLDGGRMWNDTIIELVRRAPGSILDLSRGGMGEFEIENVLQRRQVIEHLLAQLKYLPVDERQSKVDALCKIVPVSLPRNLMMTSHQVRALHSAGMEIGGHTANHPILARISNSMARTEILLGKETLEDIVRSPVRLFAYPNGKPGQDYLMDHVRTVRDLGFSAAVSTAHGVGKGDCDLYQLPRFTPWSRGLVRFTLQMARNLVIKPQAL